MSEVSSQACLSNSGVLGEPCHLSSLIFLSAKCRVKLDYLQGSPLWELCLYDQGSSELWPGRAKDQGRGSPMILVLLLCFLGF